MSETPRTDEVPSEESRIKRLREWARRALLREPSASIIERTVAEDVQHLEAKYQRDLAALREQLAERDAEIAALKAERDTSVAVTERIKVALRIRGTGSYVEWAAYCRDALEKLERAEAELAAERERADRSQEDAERYRWLRMRPSVASETLPSSHQRFWYGAELDAAIDAARRK